MLDPAFLATQALNGIQLGLMLFLMAAGLTLVFGIMNLINLAHGSLYMVGAYLAAVLTPLVGSFLLAGLIAVPATMVLGMALEALTLRGLYARDHLDQVLATFGLILFFNEGVRMAFGASALDVPLPGWLNGQVEWGDFLYPVYRLVLIIVGLAVAAWLFWLITRTRLGMLIRAGASNRAMLGALGVDVRRLYTGVFGLGAGLAALGGVMTSPIRSVESGMGEPVLILAFVVMVVGGIGSIRGAFVAALLIGVVDTMGRSLLPMTLRMLLPPSVAGAAGPAVASMVIYLLMAAILVVKPRGLLPARTG